MLNIHAIEVTFSIGGKLAEGSNKGPSAQYSRSNLQPIYQWAVEVGKKAASWKKANSFSSPVRHFLPPSFLPKVTAQIRPTSYSEVSSVSLSRTRIHTIPFITVLCSVATHTPDSSDDPLHTSTILPITPPFPSNSCAHLASARGNRCAMSGLIFCC